MSAVLRDGDAVRNKDRMAVAPILDLGSQQLQTILLDVGHVVHTIVPQLRAFTGYLDVSTI